MGMPFGLVGVLGLLVACAPLLPIPAIVLMLKLLKKYNFENRFQLGITSVISATAVGVGLLYLLPQVFVVTTALNYKVLIPVEAAILISFMAAYFISIITDKSISWLFAGVWICITIILGIKLFTMRNSPTVQIPRSVELGKQVQKELVKNPRELVEFSVFVPKKSTGQKYTSPKVSYDEDIKSAKVSYVITFPNQRDPLYVTQYEAKNNYKFARYSEQNCRANADGSPYVPVSNTGVDYCETVHTPDGFSLSVIENQGKLKAVHILDLGIYRGKISETASNGSFTYIVAEYDTPQELLNGVPWRTELNTLIGNLEEFPKSGLTEAL